MKNLQSIILFLIITFTAYAGDKNVHIHVTFKNESPDSLYFFFDPGLSLNSRNLICYVDSEGSYDLNIEIENSNLVWVTINGYLCWLMVSPGDNIDLTFLGGFYQLPFENNEKSSCMIEGNNMLGNVELNRLFKSKYCYCNSQIEVDTFVAENIVKISDEILENELSAFDKLLASNSIDTTFYNAISKFLEYNKASVLVNTIIKNYDKNNVSKEDKHKLLKIIEHSYADYPLNANWVLIMGTTLQAYINNYLNYMELANPDEYKLQVDAGNRNTYQYELLKEECSPTTFEKIGLSFLVTRTFKLGDREELDLYNSYINEYPNIKYPHDQSKLEENIKNIKSLMSYEAKNLSPDIKIIDNSEEINSLDKLLSNLAGSNVYVDIWATWCGACLAEHWESEFLEEYAEKTSLKLLYISTDKQSEENKWMNYIKQNELKGYHILANKKLIQSLKKEIPDFGSIPRYLIINKNGDIVDFDARRPSDGDLLIRQLNEKTGH